MFFLEIAGLTRNAMTTQINTEKTSSIKKIQNAFDIL